MQKLQKESQKLESQSEVMGQMQEQMKQEVQQASCHSESLGENLKEIFRLRLNMTKETRNN